MRRRGAAKWLIWAIRTPYAAGTPNFLIVARLSAGCGRVISRFGMLSKTLFHPSVAAWFEEHFKAPTPAQTEAWPLIKAGRNVLIAAPTGSGKTLAAFMAAIDDLIRQGIEGGLKDETQIVYVSPLKALSNDIR